MERIQMATIARAYVNAGQHAEQVFRFTMTGIISRADNRPATECGDCGDIQVKSARATVCKGTDIDKYLNADAAKRYAYVTADFKIAFIMSKTEWKQFVNKFGTVTRESAKNGGKEKIRLKAESKEMREWFEKA